MVICKVSMSHRPKNWPILHPHQLPYISLRALGRNGLTFHLLMYPYQLQYWLYFCHDVFILFILSELWLSKTSQICGFGAFSEERMGRIAWNLTRCPPSDFSHCLLICVISVMSAEYDSLPIWQTFGGWDAASIISLDLIVSLYMLTPAIVLTALHSIVRVNIIVHTGLGVE